MTSVAAKVVAGDEKPKLADMEYVKMSTSMGDIYIELNRFKAPITVQNFLDYVDSGFYEGTIFHRVMSGFMIQGGGFTKDMTEKPVRPGIKNEWQNGLQNKRGTIAMARRGGQADSATSQFFINVVDNPALDMARDGSAYAVFGKVIKGMEVADQIRGVKTATAGPHGDVPVEPIMITKVIRVNANDPIVKTEAAKSRLEAEAQAKRDAEAQKNAAESALKVVREHGGDVAKGAKTPSGLWYVDLKEGTGATPSTPSQMVRIHYTGWLANGTKFQSSVDSGRPMDHPLNQFAKGFTEGLSSMKVGGKRMLVIPPELGYGAAGRPPLIPANSTLIFEVELIELLK